MITKDKKTQVNFQMSAKDKEEVTSIFNYYGLDLSTGIKMYLKTVQHTKSIPLPLPLKPVTELQAAMDEADHGNFAATYDSVDDFKKAMHHEN